MQLQATDEAVHTVMEPRPKLDAAPSNLAEAKRNARSLTPRAGSDRGHRYVPALPLLDQTRPALVLPPEDAEDAKKHSWFERIQIKERWKKSLMKQLDEQVEELLAINERQCITVKALRAEITRLERMQHSMAVDIVRYIWSTPALKDAAKTKKIEENPEWAVILGLGYNGCQKLNLV